jgi:hypothetical protein
MAHKIWVHIFKHSPRYGYGSNGSRFKQFNTKDPDPDLIQCLIFRSGFDENRFETLRKHLKHFSVQLRIYERVWLAMVRLCRKS